MAGELKILYYSDARSFGGAEAYLTTLARAANQAGYAVEVAMTRARAQDAWTLALADQTLRVHRLPVIRSLQNPIPFLRQFAFLLTNRFHLIHFNQIDPWSCSPGILAARFSGHRKLISTSHLPNTVYEVPAPLRARLAPHLLQHTILVGRCHLENRTRHDGGPPHKHRVVVNGIPLPEAATPENRGAARSELGLSASVPIIGTVGRLTGQKNHRTLVEAAARVPRAHFALIGDGPDGENLRDLRDRLALQDRFHFLGERPDAGRLLRAFDIFALPSLYEGLPLALLEAMGAGLPVVASDLPAVREVMRTDQDGILVAPSDPGALAGALNTLLDDPDRAAAMGRSGRDRVRSDFSEDRMIQETLALYREVLGEVRP